MLNEQAFLADFNNEQNAAEAAQLKWWILHYIDKKKLVSADEIYRESECGDIAMYLALHELIINNLIVGPNPYDGPLNELNPHGGHNNMIYELARNDAARFFSDAAQRQAEKWNPDLWGVNAVRP